MTSNARRDASLLAALRGWHSRLAANEEVTDETELSITYGELDAMLRQIDDLSSLRRNLVELPDDGTHSTD